MENRKSENHEKLLVEGQNMVVVRSKPDFWRPLLMDIVLLEANFGEEVTILRCIYEVRPSVDMSLWILKQVVVDIKLVC